jgi:4-diphosphocytidyl-2-C-methyl-D-erythritol kinase
VLVLPDFGVSTKDAFGWLDHGRPDTRVGSSVNDLEAPVVAHHPEIGRIISALTRVRATQAAMSGSGSAVFGLFSNQIAATAAARRLGGRGRRALVTRTVNRAEYRRALAPI